MIYLQIALNVIVVICSLTVVYLNRKTIKEIHAEMRNKLKSQSSDILKRLLDSPEIMKRKRIVRAIKKELKLRGEL